MSILTEYIYPNRDIITTGFIGSPDNINKFNNVKEGVLSFNDGDIVTKSGLSSQINGLSTFSFGLNSSHVVASSIQLNMRANVSGVSGDSGFFCIYEAFLRNSNSGILGRYDYKSVGEPIYQWNLSSNYSTLNIPFSSINTSFNSAYLLNPTCDITFSGSLSSLNPTVNNFKLNVSAFEFVNSGVIGVDNSGIPLFISGPHPVSDCLTVIDASGYPHQPTYVPSSWLDNSTMYLENIQNWWQAVSNGVHNPNDGTYIKVNPNTLIHPVGLSGLGNDYNTWGTENAILVSNSPDSIRSINSGIHPPTSADNSYFTKTPPGGSPSPYTAESPQILFNKPDFVFTDVAIGFRGYIQDSANYVALRNIKLKNSTGAIINTWSEDIVLSSSIGTQLTRFTTCNAAGWSYVNNYLTFDLIHSGNGLPMPGLDITGNVKLTEIDLVPRYNSAQSPNFYFHKPTINNNDAGTTICFRMYNGGSDTFPVTISGIFWKDSVGNVLSEFNGISIIPSSLQNYCTNSISGVPVSNITDRNYIYFTSTVSSGYNLSDILYSEIELCCSGLDPISTSGIPLFISASELVSSGIDLFIDGYGTENSGIPLYIGGFSSSSSGIPLYTVGGLSQSSGIPLYTSAFDRGSGNFPLYIAGPILESSGTPLYIAGPIPYNDSMPLFLKTDTIPVISGGFPLTIWSTTNSGLFDRFPLYIQGTGTQEGAMPLYLLGQHHYDISGSMPLFIKTIGNLDGSLTVESGVPLFLGNYWTSQNSGISLYITTDSGTEGAIPINGSMPLYIARDTESTANNIPLYLKVGDVGSGILPMFINGAYVTSSGIPLVIPSTFAVASSTIQMYSHGF